MQTRIFMLLLGVGLALCAPAGEPARAAIERGTSGFWVSGDGVSLWSADGVTWQPSTASAAPAHSLSPWRRTCRGEGVTVAVDDEGRLRTSRDGMRWELRDAGTDFALHAVAWGRGRFVAVGNEGALTTSRNGWEWTALPGPTDERLRGAAHGAGSFVVVGYAGVVLTSDDGERWRLRSSGTTRRLLDVAYGDRTFVAVGWDGSILTSRRGRQWSPRVSGTQAHLRRVRFSGSTPLGSCARSFSRLTPLERSRDEGETSRVRLLLDPKPNARAAVLEHSHPPTNLEAL